MLIVASCTRCGGKIVRDIMEVPDFRRFTGQVTALSSQCQGCGLLSLTILYKYDPDKSRITARGGK